MSELKPVTVKELDELTFKLALKENEKEVLEVKLKDLNIETARLEAQCTAYLKELNRTEYESKFGKLEIQEKWSVNLPASDIEKKEFFEWLRIGGIFDKYATVNSRSLQSLFKAEWDEAKKRGEGMMFTLPGIAAPKLFEKTSFKMAKELKMKTERANLKGGKDESGNAGTGPKFESDDEIPY